jgi:hypothetical protein
MQLSQLQQLFARDVVKLLLFIEEEGFFFTFGETYRTAEQAELYAKQGKGIVNSLHCKRLAIDINVFNEKCEFLTSTKDYEVFGKYWESLHPTNRWGGKFTDKSGKPKPDGNHFERQVD